MHKFKLKTGIGNVYTIEKFKFEETTKQKSPYYTYNEKSVNYHNLWTACPQVTNRKKFSEGVDIFAKLGYNNNDESRCCP